MESESMTAMVSNPVRLRYSTGLRDTAGNTAHAATFIRERLVVLDEALQCAPEEHARILAHELFHFVWVRLGNARRLEWEGLLRTEREGRARGETGWSAEWRKRKLRAEDVSGRTRRWREYCCESFCDTGAWAETGCATELTLSRGRSERRRGWFQRHAREFAKLKPQCLIPE